VVEEEHSQHREDLAAAAVGAAGGVVEMPL
jgi:hypothetical protein